MNYTKRTWASLDDAPDVFTGECPIEPKPWERPYPWRNGKGRLTVVKPARTRHYESACRRWLHHEYGWARPMEGELRFEAEFAIRRPARRSRREVYASTKPDIDNLARAFLEAFEFKIQTARGERLDAIGRTTPIVAMSLSKRWAESDEWGSTRFALTSDGGDGVAYSDALLSLDAPSARRGRDRRMGESGIVRVPYDSLPDAPDSYARFWDIPPVAWQPMVVYGTHIGLDAHSAKFQSDVRARAMADYGLRKPMDEPMLLEMEVLLPADGCEHPWLQWLVLVDYTKSLLDALDYRKKTVDGRHIGVLVNDSRIVAITASMRACDEKERGGIRFALSRVDAFSTTDIAPIFDHIDTGRIL